MPALALVATIACLIGTAEPGAAPRAKAAARPNIVVIETDDQTLESMRVMSSTLRLFGAEGTTFDNNFVSFSLCCPSRSTFLTGQYAHNHGVLGNSPPIGGYSKLDHTNTLAVWLKNAGYYTIEVGKYLNGYGKPNPAEVPPGWSEWHAGVNLAFLGGTMNNNGVVTRLPADESGYQTDVWAAIVRDAIVRRAPAAEPFFIWFTPHVPHVGGPRDPDDPPGLGTTRPAARHRDHFANEPLPQPASFNEADVSDKPAGIRNRPLLTAQRIAGMREAYQQQLEALLGVDEAVAGIVDELKASGELDNTVLIYTDDNGFFYGEHRVPAGKVLVYEPSIRVPLLMRGPGIPKNRHLTQEVANIDLAPTILDLANAKAGRTMDGRSLLPLLEDPKLQWGRDIEIENGPGGAGANAGAQHFSALRTPRYLYAEYGNGDKELYDLSKDPNELTSLRNDPRIRRPPGGLRRAAGAHADVRRPALPSGPESRAQPALHGSSRARQRDRLRRALGGERVVLAPRQRARDASQGAVRGHCRLAWRGRPVAHRARDDGRRTPRHARAQGRRPLSESRRGQTPDLSAGDRSGV